MDYIPIQFSPSLYPLAYLYYHDDSITIQSGATLQGKTGPNDPITPSQSGATLQNKTGPNDPSIDHQIVELGRTEDNSDWVFHRTRPDRAGSFGNDFLTAELTWNNYVNKFPLDNLWKRPGDYFMEDASNIHAAPNGYKRYFIRRIMEDNFRDAKYIVDEASGRGADLARYQTIGVKNCLFIDISAAAIAELISRKFSYLEQKGNRSGGRVDATRLITKDVNNMTIHTLVTDLKTSVNELLAMTYQFGVYNQSVNGIICNFALHYLCDDVNNIRNLLEFNSKILRIGGVFMFTIMDGQKIFDLLKDIDSGKSWESRENEIIKYAIRKDYAGNKLADFGQMIAVKLPMNINPISEPLCNLTAVLREAKKFGFVAEINTYMDTEFAKFAISNAPMESKLTAEDRKYISLFKLVTLRKVK